MLHFSDCYWKRNLPSFILSVASTVYLLCVCSPQADRNSVFLGSYLSETAMWIIHVVALVFDLGLRHICLFFCMEVRKIPDARQPPFNVKLFLLWKCLEMPPAVPHVTWRLFFTSGWQRSNPEAAHCCPVWSNKLTTKQHNLLCNCGKSMDPHHTYCWGKSELLISNVLQVQWQVSGDMLLPQNGQTATENQLISVYVLHPACCSGYQCRFAKYVNMVGDTALQHRHAFMLLSPPGPLNSVGQ